MLIAQQFEQDTLAFRTWHLVSPSANRRFLMPRKTILRALAMTRRMFINAIHPEECRVAVADDDHLVELEVERADSGQLRGNIYKAAITRIEPSLQAAFLDIGAERNGFLQINDVNPSYFNNWPPEGSSGSRSRPAIQDVLYPGQELVIQVVKDGRDAKGATITTNLSIPGRYLVLMIGNQRGGVSRKIFDENQRNRLRQAISRLVVPSGMGVIVRTAGINKSTTELQKDLDGLLEVWHELLTRSIEPGVPKLLYQESNLAIRSIRDYLTPDVEEILIDHRDTYEQARSFVERVISQFATRLIFYDKPQPLFSAYHLEDQMEATSHPEVILPSGGSIVINVTEAIVAIDVNSGRSTGQSDVEETAFNTNLEAARMIAKQLRLRDLGGLIVIDFIDMWDKRHKQVVERALKEAVRDDKAKVEIGRISKFGLMEMSRQRLKTSLVSQSQMLCANCNGTGRVKTIESASLEALRKIQSAAYAGGIGELRVRMSPAAAVFLLNNKRHQLASCEVHTHARILIIPDGRIKAEEYQIEVVTAGHEVKRERAQALEARTEAPPQRQESNSVEGRNIESRRESERGQRGAARGDSSRNRKHNKRGYNKQNYSPRGSARRRQAGPDSRSRSAPTAVSAEPQEKSGTARRGRQTEALNNETANDAKEDS